MASYIKSSHIYIHFHPEIFEKYDRNPRRLISALFVVVKICKPSNSSSTKGRLKIILIFIEYIAVKVYVVVKINKVDVYMY